jgi:Ni/Fe-hydrogenase 1 B-type cytochrome subunit
MTKKRIYVWSAAVRLEHWVHVLAMTGLIFTGFYIHSPFLEGGEAVMAWMRFIHFVSMYALIFGLIFRVYIAFNPNDSGDWKELFPLPRNLAGIPEMLAYYLFIKDTHKPYDRYNPLQGLVYFLMGVMLLVMIFTGFAMYDGWLSSSFGWVNVMLGGLAVTHLVHYLGMWILICMAVVHLYFVIIVNLMERNRMLLSMVDGWGLKDSPD